MNPSVTAKEKKMEKPKKNFSEVAVSNWGELLELLSEMREDNGKWIYRGQTSDWELKTSLERAHDDFEIELKDAPQIEYQLIREFRRCYAGTDRYIVMENTLYCLALMQHHGAPTRLLDCTYSPFVAAYFALERKPQEVKSRPQEVESKKPASVIWCFNQKWLDDEAIKTVKGNKKKLLRKRPDSDKARNDDRDNFIPLYMPGPKHEPSQKFVSNENPILLNKRLIVQKGIFLCPGKVSDSFETNLEALSGWERMDSIQKLRLEFANDPEKRNEALNYLHYMNVDNATLFSGLDGFAGSLQPRLLYFRNLHWKGYN